MEFLIWGFEYSLSSSKRKTKKKLSTSVDIQSTEFKK